MADKLTHLDDQGHARMVDVSAKPPTRRTARAEAIVVINDDLARAITEQSLAKGDLLQVARLAGIQATKRTPDLIPLCHAIPIEHATVDVRLDHGTLRIEVTVTTTARTGVEMEALTGAAVAALTAIDMGKSIDRAMRIERIRLLDKTGGTRGDYHAEPLP